MLELQQTLYFKSMVNDTFKQEDTRSTCHIEPSIFFFAVSGKSVQYETMEFRRANPWRSKTRISGSLLNRLAAFSPLLF